MGVNDGIFLKGVLYSAFAPKDIKKATKKNFPCFNSAEEMFTGTLTHAEPTKVDKPSDTCLYTRISEI